MDTEKQPIRFGIFIYGNRIMPIEEPLEFLTVEAIQAYLKTKGLGVFNLSLPFNYIPKDDDNKKRL
jgi:hypothetical protein